MKLTEQIEHLAMISLIAIAGCESGSRAETYAADPAAVKRGQSIFVGTCGGYCHSSTPGPRDAPYLFDCEWIHGGSDDEIFATISSGVPNTTMVAFGGVLPEGDDDIWRVIAYLKSERNAC